jgi:hypothetical protein
VEERARGAWKCGVRARDKSPSWPKLVCRALTAGRVFGKKERVTGAGTVDDVRWDDEDERYPCAWQVFLAELSNLEQSEQLAFLQSLGLETSAPDLALLEEQLQNRLATLTGRPQSSVHALFNTLLAHLRKWTCHTRRDAEWLDGEALRACFAMRPYPPGSGTLKWKHRSHFSQAAYRSWMHYVSRS